MMLGLRALCVASSSVLICGATSIAPVAMFVLVQMHLPSRMHATPHCIPSDGLHRDGAQLREDGMQ